jgi:hypothetical protein
MTYKQLQTALKSAKAQGLTSIKLNAKKDVLQAEYDRLNAPEVAPEVTRRDILAKIIAEAPESVIDQMWEKFMGEPAPEPAPVTDEQILATIKEIDTELGTENYLPIYHLRNAYPQVKRLDMDAILYRLQKSDRIDFSTLQESGAYTADQVDAGIPQNIGGQLFFLMVNN